MKQNILKTLVIVQLLLCSINLSANKPITDAIPLRGNSDTLIAIPIGTIRRANIKLIERKHLIDLYNTQSEMIDSYSKLVYDKDITIKYYETKLDSVASIIVEQQQLNKDIIKQSNNRLKWAIISSAVAAIFIGICIYGGK